MDDLLMIYITYCVSIHFVYHILINFPMKIVIIWMFPNTLITYSILTNLFIQTHFGIILDRFRIMCILMILLMLK